MFPVGWRPYFAQHVCWQFASRFHEQSGDVLVSAFRLKSEMSIGPVNPLRWLNRVHPEFMRGTLQCRWLSRMRRASAPIRRAVLGSILQYRNAAKQVLTAMNLDDCAHARKIENPVKISAPNTKSMLQAAFRRLAFHASRKSLDEFP